MDNILAFHDILNVECSKTQSVSSYFQNDVTPAHVADLAENSTVGLLCLR